MTEQHKYSKCGLQMKYGMPEVLEIAFDWNKILNYITLLLLLEFGSECL